MGNILNFLSIVFLAVAIEGIQGQSYFVISPDVFRLNVEETVSVQVWTQTNVELYLQDAPNRLSTISKKTKNLQPKKPEIFHLKITENDIPRSWKGGKQYYYLVVKGQGFKKETEILLDFRNGTVFIQTDKPIYTPKQDVKFRIIPVGLDLKPSKEKITIEIKNPQGVRVERMKDLYAYSKGFITSQIRLGDYPMLGNWTITALFGNKDLVKSSVSFEVREYVLPKFSVKITPPPYVTEKEKRFGVKVQAKYTYGKKVKGTFRLKVSIFGKGKEIPVDDQQGVISGIELIHINVDKITAPKEIASFPVGNYLKILVQVTERATGQKENAVDKSLLLVKSPYVIGFERTVKYFKPGLPFQVRVDLRYPNKQPAKRIRLKLEATDGQKAVNLFTNAANVATTDDNGQVQFTLNMPSDATGNKKITIKVTTMHPQIDNRDAQYVVEPYQSASNSYILVRAPPVVPKVGERVQIETLIPNNLAGITQLNYLIVSRGVIVFQGVIPKNVGLVTSIALEVKPEMAPTSRIVVYYEKNGEVVADSVLMDVEDAFSNKVTLETNIKSPDEFHPSADFQLTVKTRKKSLVGVLGVDQSVYLLRNDSKLTEKKVFSDIGSFDLGCGLGAGKDNRDVFETAGLAVITNVAFSTTKRKAITCSAAQGKRRKRRAVSEMRLAGLTKKCCKSVKCCENLFSRGRISDRFQCEALKQKISSECWPSFFKCCKENFGRGRSGGGDNGIPEDEVFEVESQLRLRQDFRETWIWEERATGDKNQVQIPFTVPDTITTWVVSALSINNQTGLGLSRPLRLASSMKFFVDVKMPYSVQRKEQITIYAVLYNYHSMPVRARLYLIGHSSFCSIAKPGKRSKRFGLTIPGNDAVALPFTIIPLQIGEIPIEFITFNSVENSDRVIKRLLVVPEGVERFKTVSILLDPQDVMKDKKAVKPTVSIQSKNDGKQTDTVELSIPGNFVKDSEKVMVYITGNLMGAAVTDIIEGGLEKLLRIPTGCGEQTMIYMAPVVYVLRYLDSLKGGVTAEVERKAYTYARQGYTRELKWRRDDSSYSAWGNRRAGSTWLTAFVNKVFCQAREFIKDHIDENIVCQSAQFLLNQQSDDGKFVEKQAVIHREMTGGVSSGKTALTAFVLISLLECKSACKNLNSDSILIATAYLENQLQQIKKPYVMALVTYALALADSPRKSDANKKLRGMITSEVRKGRQVRYWKENGAALTVEATAYALLAQLKLKEVEFSGPVVIWLTEERNARGSFHSTQDTCIALQALSEYSIKTAGSELDMTVEITSAVNNNIKKKFEITPDNALVRQQAEITGALGGRIFIDTAGKGTAQLQIETKYNVPSSVGEQCGYELEVTTDEGIVTNVVNDAGASGAKIQKPKKRKGGRRRKKCKKRGGRRNRRRKKCPKKKSKKSKQGDQVVNQINVQVCARHKHANASGMAMIEVGLLTGFKADEQSVKQLISQNRDPRINHYEISDRYVIFYLDTIPDTEKTCIRFLTRRVFDVGDIQPVPVKVYDYYEPDDACTTFYGPKKDSELLKLICEENECECGQGGCAVDDVSVSPKSIKRKACLETDFVFVGKVLEVTTENSWQRIAIKSTDIIKPGKVDYKPGAKVLVYQMSSCEYPKFKKGKEYIVMLKDGIKYVINNEAFVMEYPKKGRDKKIENALAEVKIGVICDSPERLRG